LFGDPTKDTGTRLFRKCTSGFDESMSYRIIGKRHIAAAPNVLDLSRNPDAIDLAAVN